MQTAETAIVATSWLAAYAVLQALDVWRLRLRGKILAQAPPGIPMRGRNVRRDTKRSADDGKLDLWSARVLGTWWAWRVMMALGGFVTFCLFGHRFPGSRVLVGVLGGTVGALLGEAVKVLRLRSELSQLSDNPSV